MICGTCSTEGVENQVLGKVFYYCRTCKEEIALETPNNPNIHDEAPWWHSAVYYPPGNGGVSDAD